MGNLLDVSCPCGYRAEGLCEGGLLGGKVAGVFACADCAELVSALVYSANPEGLDRRVSVKGQLVVVPRCPRCGSADVERWSSGAPCPRCEQPLAAEIVGIAD